MPSYFPVPEAIASGSPVSAPEWIFLPVQMFQEDPELAECEDEISSIPFGSDLEEAVQEDTEFWETKPMVVGKSKHTRIPLDGR